LVCQGAEDCNTDAGGQGYALIEYTTLSDAKAAIEGANGEKLLDQTISVDYAFVRPPPGKTQQARGGAARKSGGGRARSGSPGGRRHEEDDDVKEEGD
jgi:RNA-binding protein 8A